MNLSLRELVERFLLWASRCLTKKTEQCYSYHLLRFSAAVGELQAREVKSYHLQEWGKSWHDYQAVQRLFLWAVEDAELLERTPFKKLRRPPLGERHRVLTRKEEFALLRSASPPLRALLIAYRETFARPGEMRAANIEDLHAEGGRTDLLQALRDGRASLILREYKSRKRRKNPNCPRVILLSPRVGRLIARRIESSGRTEGPIFRNQSGKRWTANAVRCCFRRLRRRAGVNRDAAGEQLVPYSFRHTGATNAAACGVRDRLLAELMGHTSTRTTARYQHLAVEHLRAAMVPLWNSAKDRTQARIAEKQRSRIALRTTGQGEAGLEPPANAIS